MFYRAKQWMQLMIENIRYKRQCTVRLLLLLSHIAKQASA